MAVGGQLMSIRSNPELDNLLNRFHKAYEEDKTKHEANVEAIKRLEKDLHSALDKFINSEIGKSCLSFLERTSITIPLNNMEDAARRVKEVHYLGGTGFVCNRITKENDKTTTSSALAVAAHYSEVLAEGLNKPEFKSVLAVPDIKQAKDLIDYIENQILIELKKIYPDSRGGAVM